MPGSPQGSNDTTQAEDPDISKLLLSPKLLDSLPDAFRCPLSGSVLTDPVKTADGKVYQRCAIEEWFRKGELLSPLTGVPMETVRLTPDKALKAAIIAYLAHFEESEEVISHVEPAKTEDSSRTSDRNLNGESGADDRIAEYGDFDEVATPVDLGHFNQDLEIKDMFDRLKMQVELTEKEISDDTSPGASMLAAELDYASQVLALIRDATTSLSSDDGTGLKLNSGGVFDHVASGPAELEEDTGRSLSISASRPPGRDSTRRVTGKNTRNPSQEIRNPKAAACRPRMPLSPVAAAVASRTRDRVSTSPPRVKMQDSPSSPSTKRATPRPHPSSSSRCSLNSQVTTARPRSPQRQTSLLSPPVLAGHVHVRSSITPLKMHSRQRGVSVPSTPANNRFAVATHPSTTTCHSRQQGTTSGYPSMVLSNSSSGPRGPVRPLQSTSAPYSKEIAEAASNPRRPPLPKDARTRLVTEHARQSTTPTIMHASVAEDTDSASVETVDDSGRTLLMLAARDGNLEWTRQLLERGASVDAADTCLCTALMYAATYGHVEVARCLVENAANIDANSKDRWTPLIAAAYNKHLQVVQLLLSRKANIESADERGWTSLMHVAFNGHTDGLKCLLDQQARVEAQDTNGRTALAYAAFNGHCENIELLLAQHAKVDGSSDPAALALLFAVNHDHGSAVAAILKAAGPSKTLIQRAMQLASDQQTPELVERLMTLAA